MLCRHFCHFESTTYPGRSGIAVPFTTRHPTRYHKSQCSPSINQLSPLRSEILCYPHLPLAVYREIAAHLQQIDGVATELLPPSDTAFNYANSQIGGLLITYPEGLNPDKHLNALIDFYGARYGTPQRSEVSMAVL
jgi:hypothetical protein